MTLCQKISRFHCCSPGEPWGTLFSSLQATEQAWQPTHLSRSMTIPHRAMVVPSVALCLVDADPGREVGGLAAEPVVVDPQKFVRVGPDPSLPAPVAVVALARRHRRYPR